jgi:hypothetical protein
MGHRHILEHNKITGNPMPDTTHKGQDTVPGRTASPIVAMDMYWLGWHKATEIAKYDILSPHKETVLRVGPYQLGWVPVPSVYTTRLPRKISSAESRSTRYG